jgi:hypothetical protein
VPFQVSSFSPVCGDALLGRSPALGFRGVCDARLFGAICICARDDLRTGHFTVLIDFRQPCAFFWRRLVFSPVGGDFWLGRISRVSVVWRVCGARS